ncbi:MAG: dehydrogenase, partial [Clostridia bacterium]|nr:dehydrogenase [Clostridia bacterium]
FAGGGTDLESFSTKYGGAVLNAAVCMFAYCTIIPTNDGKIVIKSHDNNSSLETESAPELPIVGDKLILHLGVYNRIVKQFNGGKPLSFIMSTSNDAPVGSGLGTSSTMVVAILKAFDRWLGLNLDDYTLANLAYDIERKDLKLAGGKQDQYAAVFGGFNFMEFRQDGATLVNTLRLERSYINELESSFVLYYGGKSRSSANQQLVLTKNIIASQIKGAESNSSTVDAMKDLKENAYKMKDCLLLGDTKGIGDCLKAGWEKKKLTSSVVSNKDLEKTISYATEHGAEAVKVSGAGGGGFLLLYCDPVNRQELINALNELPGKVFPVSFNKRGAESWVINKGDKI